MLTMVSDLKSVRQAIDHGCHDFITKPFAPIRLLKAVKYAVKQLERQNEQSLVQSMATEELDTFHIG
jgi:FixJ family two-component response regulator